jgi:hypothetical protein
MAKEFFLMMLDAVGRHDIIHVLAHFEYMGASSDELEQECRRLVDDENYCKQWCTATGFNNKH